MENSEHSLEKEKSDEFTTAGKYENVEIFPYKNNLYQHKFKVYSGYCKFIIGAKGSTKKEIQRESGTIIFLDDDIHDASQSEISIRGDSKEDIIFARHMIDNIIVENKSKLRYTHFVSIPTNSEEIRGNFEMLQNNILGKSQNFAEGLQKEMFAEVGRLHLTVSMLLLIEKGDEQRAREVLHKCKKDIILPILDKSGPICFELKGLKSMESNLTKARVLYVQAHEETGYLQEMANKIYDYMITQGFTRRQYNQVTLHMTVINVNNIKDEKNQRNFRNTFDATNIMKAYGDTYFGKVNLTTLHISQLKTRTEDGYYQAIEIVDLLDD